MKKANIIGYAFLVFASIGLADALYLTQEFYGGRIPSCSLKFANCEAVLSSTYATLGPFPVAVLGLIFYATIISLTLVFFASHNLRLLTYVALFTFVGLSVSLVLVYIQVFVLKAICIYCLTSALVSLTLAIIGYSALYLRKDSSSGMLEK
jgi:uncharacterized membrane protein